MRGDFHSHLSLHKNQFCVMKKRDPFPIKEMDLKFKKMVFIYCLTNIKLKKNGNAIRWP